MNKKILILLIFALVALGSLSTFFEFSSMSGSFVGAPIVTNAYAIATFFILLGVAFYMMFRKHSR